MSDAATLTERVHVALRLLKRSERADDLTSAGEMIRAAVLVLTGESE